MFKIFICSDEVEVVSVFGAKTKFKKKTSQKIHRNHKVFKKNLINVQQKLQKLKKQPKLVIPAYLYIDASLE